MTLPTVVGSKLRRNLTLVVEDAGIFSSGQIGELRHLAHACYVAEKRSSRVSEALAEQGLLEHQWLMGEMAPRRGEHEVSKISDLQESGKVNRPEAFRGVPRVAFPPRVPGEARST